MGTYWKNITFVATISTTDFDAQISQTYTNALLTAGGLLSLAAQQRFFWGGQRWELERVTLNVQTSLTKRYQRPAFPKWSKLSFQVGAMLGTFIYFCKINQYDFISWCYVDVGTFCDVDQVFDVMLLLIVSLRLPELFGDFSGYFPVWPLIWDRAFSLLIVCLRFGAMPQCITQCASCEVKDRNWTSIKLNSAVRTIKYTYMYMYLNIYIYVYKIYAYVYKCIHIYIYIYILSMLYELYVHTSISCYF